MTTSIQRLIFCGTLLVLISFSTSFSQSFEGWILYKMEMNNPNPKLIPDSTWKKLAKEQFGQRGYATQKYYYKNDKYISEIETAKSKGYQAYSIKDKLLYSWQMNSDTAITVDSRKYMDEFIEFVDGTDTETILSIPCKAIVLKSKLGEMKLWYNSDHLKVDPKLFKDHKYGHWAQIVGKIKCLPLKVEQKAFMAHIVQTAMEYKSEPLSDTQFVLPTFSFVMANPIN